MYDNARSGFLGEHSCMDGTPTLRMTEFMLASLGAGKINHGEATVSKEKLPQPKELQWVLDDKARLYIQEAEKNFDELVGSHEMEVRAVPISCLCFTFRGNFANAFLLGLTI
jgi:carnitine O-acetyltransferase